MSEQAVAEYALAIRGRDKAAERVEKGRILDEFCATAGMHRKAETKRYRGLQEIIRGAGDMRAAATGNKVKDGDRVAIAYVGDNNVPLFETPDGRAFWRQTGGVGVAGPVVAGAVVGAVVAGAVLAGATVGAVVAGAVVAAVVVDDAAGGLPDSGDALGSIVTLADGGTVLEPVAVAVGAGTVFAGVWTGVPRPSGEGDGEATVPSVLLPPRRTGNATPTMTSAVTAPRTPISRPRWSRLVGPQLRGDPPRRHRARGCRCADRRRRRRRTAPDRGGLGHS